jgi:hypothetical protein
MKRYFFISAILIFCFGCATMDVTYDFACWEEIV